MRADALDAAALTSAGSGSALKEQTSLPNEICSPIKHHLIMRQLDPEEGISSALESCLEHAKGPSVPLVRSGREHDQALALTLAATRRSSMIRASGSQSLLSSCQRCPRSYAGRSSNVDFTTHV